MGQIDKDHVGHHAEVVRGKSVLRLHVEDAVVEDAPATIDKDFVQAPQVDPIELIGRRSGNRSGKLRC